MTIGHVVVTFYGEVALCAKRTSASLRVHVQPASSAAAGMSLIFHL